jgi:hypothetical protein
VEHQRREARVDHAAPSTETGWRTAYFATPVDATAGTTYVASYHAPNGNYAIDGGYFASARSNGPLSAPAGANGMYGYGAGGFPTQSYNSANYWVDPLFVADGTAPEPGTPPVGAYGLFTGADTPAAANWDDPDAVELGMKVTPAVDGMVYGVKFYKGPTNTGTHTGTLWSAGGTQLATVTFAGETASGWQTALFSEPVAVTAGQQYVVSYHTEVGRYAVTGGGLSSSRTVSDLTVPAAGATYRYGTGGTMPVSSSSGNYWVDLVFAPS